MFQLRGSIRLPKDIIQPILLSISLKSEITTSLAIDLINVHWFVNNRISVHWQYGTTVVKVWPNEYLQRKLFRLPKPFKSLNATWKEEAIKSRTIKIMSKHVQMQDSLNRACGASRQFVGLLGNGCKIGVKWVNSAHSGCLANYNGITSCFYCTAVFTQLTRIISSSGSKYKPTLFYEGFKSIPYQQNSHEVYCKSS